MKKDAEAKKVTLKDDVEKKEVKPVEFKAPVMDYSGNIKFEFN